MAEPMIVALGSVNVDFQMRVERWPEAGETLVAHDFSMLGGGKAANVAFLARRLGRPAVLVGRVGSDPLAERAIAPLRAAGVDLRYLRQLDGQSTAASFICVRPDGDKSIVLATGANDGWPATDVADTDAALAGAPSGSVLVIDLEVPIEIVRHALGRAAERQVRVVLDPSPATRMPPDLFEMVEVITPNPAEAAHLTGVHAEAAADAERAGRELVRRGVRLAAMKLGSGGCVLVGGDGDAGALHIEPPRVEVVDKTGAGDAFAGALGVALLEGQAPPEAARVAVVAASIAVSRYGSQPAYPGRDELARWLADGRGGRH